jgi:tRNA(Ile)-lysidine synthase
MEMAVGIAHCDHAWRVDSGANAQHVANLARQWQVPFFLEVAANLAFAEGLPQKQSEAQARVWRYQKLGAIAQAHQYSTVVTGHTASDRAETLLHNLIRGSGSDGLQSLVWKRSLVAGVELVRPLLGLTRVSLTQFCQAQKLAIWEDSTNQDWGYRRNRIRQQLFPYLQRQFNPQVEEAIAQTAEVLQAEVEYLEAQATQLLDAAQSQLTAAHPAGFNRHILQSAPLALQRRAIRQFLQHNLPSMPNFDQIESLVFLLIAPNRSRSAPFPGGAIAEVEGQWIWLRCPQAHLC